MVLGSLLLVGRAPAGTGALAGLGDGAFGLVLLGAGAAVWAAWLGLSRPSRRERRALRHVAAVVDAHRDTLRMRRGALVSLDPYGVPVTRRWERERDGFVRNLVDPALHAHGLDVLSPGAKGEAVDALLDTLPNGEAGGELSQPRAEDPFDFEVRCAAILQIAGWDASVTPPGGDQGADVLARRDGAVLVVQCKLHRRPIGNKAVQEVAAARGHFRADRAAVVSNRTYTRAARDLARSLDVALLHVDELEGWARR